jgi:hypothetical protein
MSNKKEIVVAIILFIVVTSVFLIIKRSLTEPKPPAQPIFIEKSFNGSDLSISSNGNIEIARERLNRISPDSSWEMADTGSIESISRSPYDYMGIICRVSGRVYKVEQAAPDGINDWTNVALSLKNRNSPVSQAVYFIYKGKPDDVQLKKRMAFAGYFCGTSTELNAMGGAVSVFWFVGNKIEQTPSSL